MCRECGKPKCGCQNRCGFSPSVLQINNSDCVLLEAVDVPASAGDDSEGSPYAPKNGRYKNTLVTYEANGNIYLYTSSRTFRKISSLGDLSKYSTIEYSDEKDAETLASAKEYTDEVADGKVDKEEGKGLSTNDYTNADKAKLNSLGKTLTIIDNEETITYDGTQDVEIEISHLDPNLYYTKTETDGLISAEATSREEADNNLQEQIDAIVASSDVVDIVGTYAELQAYDTSKLGDNDIVKVLSDSTHDDATAYYRWDKDNSTWEYVGSEGPYYTKAETDNLLNDKQDTLTAGDNISISNNVISATDTTYTATDGVKIENGVIKLDPATALAALGYQEMEITVVDNAQVTQSLTVIGKVNQTRKNQTKGSNDFAEDGCPNMTDEEFRAWQEEQNNLIIEGE